MFFNKTKLEGVFVIDIQKKEDERGFFSTLWNDKIFKKNNLNFTFTESDISFNRKKGTLRGLHYETPPYERTKIVRCTKGKIFDVVLDLRSNSPTFKQWISTELTADNHKMNFIPHGCAHGFQTLDENSEVNYLISQEYNPEHTHTVRWNDKLFDINWPLKPTIISEKDSTCSDFSI